MTSKIGLGYMPSQLVKILGWRKDKQLLTQYVTTEEANDDVCENATSNSKSSVLNRLQPSSFKQHPSVFSSIERVG